MIRFERRNQPERFEYPAREYWIVIRQGDLATKELGMIEPKPFCECKFEAIDYDIYPELTTSEMEVVLKWMQEKEVAMGFRKAGATNG